jgi:protein involved in polysaccharide export with SLBB domain
MVWHRRMITLFGLVLAVGLAAGCSSSSPPLAIPEAAGAGAGGAPIDDISGYKLGPGDALRVTVFRHEDLSGEFSLDGEGYFALPLVGEILAGGRTARQVESEVEVALKSGGYLVDPQVSIEVLNYRPFYIIGEVNNPGSFEYVSGMTVINAVALAGGYTYRADQDDIIISRGGSNGPRIEALPDTEVLPGDIIEVTERFF